MAGQSYQHVMPNEVEHYISKALTQRQLDELEIAKKKAET